MAGQQRTSSIDVDSAAFMAGLATAVAGLRIQSEVDLQRLALKIVRNARQLAPVDTGRLRGSIDAVRGADARGPYYDVGTNVSYAPFVEYGTSRQAAQPFMRPAIAEAAQGGL